MGEIPLPVVLDFFTYLFIPFAFAFIFSRLRSSPVTGYLLGGIVVGNLLPHTASGENVERFAYFGIILLFFTVGLEVNFARIRSLKRYIVTGGLLQLFFTAIAVSVVSLLFGFSFSQGLLLGIALASSSTSLVAKIIQDRREEGTLLGEITIGLLMLQDLAFIPMVILITATTQNVSSFSAALASMGWGLFVSALIIFLMFTIGSRVVPAAIDRIARLRRDLLNFFIIVFIFFIALVSSFLHIPIVVGAFIAGVFIAHTSSHYHIFSQIRPLRDLLAALFFIYIGSQISIVALVPQLPLVFLFGITIMLIKALVIVAVFVYLRFNARFSFFMGSHLFQIGETSFILLLIAYSNKLVTESQYTMILASVMLSLILTPSVIANREKLYAAVRRFLKRFLPQIERFVATKIDIDKSPLDELSIKNHVVICGYGRVGEKVGRALALSNIPYVTIDYNFVLVENAKKQGVNALYGDCTDRDVLDYAQVEDAVAIVAAVPNPKDQELIVLNAKRLNPKIYIISRVATDEEQHRLKDLGVAVAVQPELEAAISIIRKILVLHNKSKEEILRQLHHLKLVHGAL